MSTADETGNMLESALMNTPEEQSAAPSQDRLVRRAGMVCLIGFGLFLLWGAFAPLEEGISAGGKIVVEGDRQAIQHLEGGIVREIRVRDGQVVKPGDVLMVLENTAPLAARDQVVKQYAALAAAAERMRALQEGRPSLRLGELDGMALGADEKRDIAMREQTLFAQQRQAYQTNLAVIDSRIAAARSLQSSRQNQMAIASRELRGAQDELGLVQNMVDQQLARRDQATSAARLVASLEGEIARLGSERQGAASQIADLQAQKQQITADFYETNGTQLRDTSSQLLTAQESLTAAQDILNRSEIKAPLGGEVLNLQFATIGGVVQPGDLLLEIVPKIESVQSSLRIAPADRTSVYKGQKVRIQFSSYKGWEAPRLSGTVTGVSADLKTDQANSSTYYEVKVIIPPAEMARANKVTVIAGMPVDAFIYSGKSRTMFDYLFDPLYESLFRGLRSR